MNSTREAPAASKAVSADEGEALWWSGALAVIKTTAEDTGGRFSIIDVTEPPGAEAPLHVHSLEDEAFWILEGSVTIQVGDETVEAGPGDYAMGPRGVPHRYTVGPDGCRLLFICTPGGFEDMVRDMSVPAKARRLPVAGDMDPDADRSITLSRDYGLSMVEG